MNDQQQPRQKRSAGYIFFTIVACVSVIFALLSLCAPIWGYLFIWGVAYHLLRVEKRVGKKEPKET
jgi:fatty acid desaturase